MLQVYGSDAHMTARRGQIRTGPPRLPASRAPPRARREEAIRIRLKLTPSARAATFDPVDFDQLSWHRPAVLKAAVKAEVLSAVIREDPRLGFRLPESGYHCGMYAAEAIFRARLSSS